MRLLLTRPLADSRDLAEKLAARGHESLIEPMLTVEPLWPALPLAGVQALALTSRHGLDFLEALLEEITELLHGLPLYAVGGATAERARAAGFPRVHDAEGDGAALAAVIAKRLDPRDGAILHLAGSEVSPAFGEALRGSGFALRSVATYRTLPAKALSQHCREALLAERLDAATFLSPKTAVSFVRLVGEAGVAAACDRLLAFCLSPAVAQALAPLGWNRVVVAERPRLDDLIAAIDAAPAKAGAQQKER